MAAELDRLCDAVRVAADQMDIMYGVNQTEARH